MSRLNVLGTIAGRDFHESMDNYKPQEADFLDLVRQMLPADWSFHRNHGVWFEYRPPIELARLMPQQGWKMHISSTNSHAEDVLRAVVPIFREASVGFKFALDRRILSLMNGKQWVRQGAGKFITVYPHNEAQFVDLIERVYNATRHFSGPYILSDRRYKDSRVVFYRYGGMMNEFRLSVIGEQVPMLVSPKGELIPDERRPYFYFPEWTRDPFAPAASSTRTQASEVSLKNGRYRVKSVLRYSNSGGVYVAEDTQSGQQVVIKEARPCVESTEDSTSLLKKEYRLLNEIKDLRIAPKPLDFFQDWEHFFLVEEFISGMSLASFSARNNVALQTEPTREHTETFYKQFKIVFLQLAEILNRLREHRIVFSDLSPGNLLIDRDSLRLWIIDFEAAHQVGVDNPVQLFTRGFAYADQMAGKAATFESDYFSLGAIMHYVLWPVNEIFSIYPKARFTFINNIISDLGFPESIRQLVTALLNKDAEVRPTPQQVLEVLRRDDQVHDPCIASDGPSANPHYASDVDDIVRYILAVATYERRDRLFPDAGTVFRTNPLSIANGACGVAYVIQKTQGSLPKPVIDWILSIRVRKERFAPGLYVGIAGIAWSLLEIGLQGEAENLMKTVYEHPLLYDSFDVYYGVSGWGLASLRFFLETQDEFYLQKAKEAANHLLLTAKTDDKGPYWTNDDSIPLGYAHGASGVSLFLLYLYLACGDFQYLDFGTKALEFDINNGQSSPDGEGMTWKRLVAPSNAGPGKIVYPYWLYGSAGIGNVVVRYSRLLNETKYKDLLEKIFCDTNRKYTIYPTFFKGLAGIGEFLLDLYQHSGDSRHLDGAYRVATGISLFRIEREQGLAFPGEGLQRISCDYGTGSAGIAYFLHRLTRSGVEGAFSLERLFANVGSARHRKVAKPHELVEIGQE